jgi:uncharacterized paraquat-inducible protein A
MSKKCHQCDLVNWEQDSVCKRCGALLNQKTPPVFNWFIAYSLSMAFLYLVAAVMGIIIMFAEPSSERDAEEAKLTGIVMLIVGLMCFVPYVSTPFLGRQSWVWVFNLVLICIGLSSACCLPACIPLLIFWVKPEVRRYYGKDLTPASPPPPPVWS